MLNQEKIQDIKNHTKDLCSILCSMNPVETLRRAYWELVCQYNGVETESQIRTEQIKITFLIEYLQTLFISIDLKKELKMPTDEKEWQEIKKKVEKIRKGCFSFFLEFDRKETNKWLQEDNATLRFKALSSWLQIRGNRYAIHESENLKGLLKPHDEILKKLYKTSVCDIVEGMRKIYSAHSFAPKNLRESYEAQKDFNSFYDNLTKQKFPEKECIKLLQNKSTELKLKEKRALEYLDIQEITGWPSQFIKKFSAGPGSNKDFLINGKYAGTPFQRLPIFRKPFLEYNSKFHLFNFYALTDNFYRNIQFSVLEDQPDYSNKWKETQSAILEKMPFDILEKIIGPHEQIRNFYYKIKDRPKKQKWFECDGVILFENWLFIVEVKSGKISYQSPAENIDSHIESIKKLSTDPAKQGRRFIEALKKEGKLDLYDKIKGEIIKTVSVDNFKQALVFAVSLEQLTDISPQIQQFKSLEFKTKGEPVLFISIDDLRVYRDLSNGVIEFFHFLTERKKAFYNPQLILNDELDHFGMYLKHNQYHDITNDMPKADLNIFMGYRDKIDHYFNELYFNHGKAVKPRQNMPPVLDSIIQDLELKRKPGFIKAGLAVCSLSGKSKVEVNQHLLNIINLQRKQRRIRPFASLWDEISISLIMRIPDIQLNFIPRDYAIKNMFIQEKKEVLLFDISLDEKDKIKDVSFEWIEKSDLNEQDIKRYKKEAKEFAEFRFSLAIKKRNKKKIGRNEKCPCGNGKKYKKCHGAIK